MTLRRRVTLMSALVVGATLVLASATCYFVMRGELRGQIDDSLRELQARLRALLRRVDGPADELRFGDLRLEPATRDVWRGERRLELSRTEYALLELFLRHPRQVLERSVVFEQVWGYDFGATSNVLGVYMGYLRRKTEAGGEPRLLHTVRGVGYILREEPA